MMRIDNITVTRRDYELRNPSIVAYEAMDVAPNIIVRIDTDRGLTGWGNAAPDEHVTGENADSVWQVITESFLPELRGREVERIDRIWHRLRELAPDSPTAIAAVDIALYDLLGKAANLPVHRLIGAARDGMLTSVTLSIEELELSLERARNFCAQGFRFLKIKCGLDVDSDIVRVRAVRRVVGPDCKLSIDANQGYDTDQTLYIADVLRECGIEFIEQPVPATDLDAIRVVCARSPIPIMADESVLDGRDMLLTPAPLANLKLMKSGGITGAIKANAVAEARGIRTMVGCMDESRISMAAAAHLALALQNIQYADLDGHLDIIDDVASEGLTITEGEVRLIDAPGLGIAVSHDAVQDKR